MKKILLVCIGLLAVLIYVWSAYNRRQAIVTHGKPIPIISIQRKKQPKSCIFQKILLALQANRIR